MQSLHNSQEWNIILGKNIIKVTWKIYLSFEDVFIDNLILEEIVRKNLHDVDHISLCVCSKINMKRQKIEPSRRVFMEYLNSNDLNLGRERSCEIKYVQRIKDYMCEHDGIYDGGLRRPKVIERLCYHLTEKVIYS